MTAIATAKASSRLKTQVRAVLSEILHEEPGLLREALEDIGMARAIREGMKSGPASREEVFAKLRGRRP